VLISAVNCSEGRDDTVIGELIAGAGPHLLDLHRDPHHNRSVLTLAAATTGELLEALLALATVATRCIDLSRHHGVHPRLGALDVVPFSPVGVPPFDLSEAIAARDEFARRLSEHLQLPVFCYGPERSLPEIRRRAFVDLEPDVGPRRADPRAGACCVGARRPLVAYNLVLARPDLELARRVAREVRCREIRALGLQVGDEVQVSCNLVEPFEVGPAELWAPVGAHADIAGAELVGLVPDAVLAAVPVGERERLGLPEGCDISSRLATAGIYDASGSATTH
jgi:glutamate formiminotransferase / 5-formyltetrahydrofolate cyclo-ligase